MSLFGEGNLQQGLFTVVHVWVAVELIAANERADKRKMEAA